MKSLLLTTAFAICATATNAAVIRYEFGTHDIPLTYYGDYYGAGCGEGMDSPWYVGESDGCKWTDGVEYAPPGTELTTQIGAFMVIDTAKMTSNVAGIYDSRRAPGGFAFSEGVLDGTTVIPLTEFSIKFDENWDVADYSISFDTDGTNSVATKDGLYVGITNNHHPQMFYNSVYPGTWTKTVLTPDAPAPVPLPAAGFLLIGALGGLGLMKRRNKTVA